MEWIRSIEVEDLVRSWNRFRRSIVYFGLATAIVYVARAVHEAGSFSVLEDMQVWEDAALWGLAVALGATGMAQDKLVRDLRYKKEK